MAQRVSFEERCRIEALAGEGSWSVAEIAVHVGAGPSRLSGGSSPAAEAAVSTRPGPRRRTRTARLCGRRFPSWSLIPDWLREVTELLEWRWSPHAIGAYPR